MKNNCTDKEFRYLNGKSCRLLSLYFVAVLTLYNTAASFAFDDGSEPSAVHSGDKNNLSDTVFFVNSPNLVHDTVSEAETKNDRKIEKIKKRYLHHITTSSSTGDEKSGYMPSREEQLVVLFSDYQGRVIRNVGFKQLEIFGQSISDTTETPTKWIDKIGNQLHINTRLFVLKNRLLIAAGDTLDLYLLAENERLYRELPFIDDARTYIREISEDSVDILFVTKDVLPLGGSVELLDIAYGKASISNTSLFGLGHELYYHLTWNYDRVPFYGHKIRYIIQNIGNTFFTFNASYENQWNMEALKFSCNRDFFSQSVHYAGGVGFEKINSVRNIVFPDTIYNDIDIDYNYYDLWLGRSFSIPRLSSVNKKTNITGTARIMRYEFFKRPEVDINRLYQYHERSTYLFSFGISQVGYYTTSLVHGFGRTEDIPFGNSLIFTAGWDQDEFYNRPYYGVSYAWGRQIDKAGYFFHRIDYGTFLNYGIEQGLLSYKIKHFTPLLNNKGRYSFRLFTDISYKSGYNRFEDEFMEFTRRDGIRGLDGKNMKGNQRLNISVESVCYSPHYIMGFRFVYFAFVDAGIISNEHKILVNNPVYTGFGGGIKIRNENLIFDTILLRFGYYPKLPAEAAPEYVLLNTIRNPRFDNFIIQRPEIINY